MTLGDAVANGAELMSICDGIVIGPEIVGIDDAVGATGATTTVGASAYGSIGCMFPDGAAVGANEPGPEPAYGSIGYASPDGPVMVNEPDGPEANARGPGAAFGAAANAAGRELAAGGVAIACFARCGATSRRPAA